MTENVLARRRRGEVPARGEHSPAVRPVLVAGDEQRDREKGACRFGLISAVSTVLKRFPLGDKFRFVGRAFARKITG
ncbi:MAG: hypothetical protein PT977_11650 [Acidobacteriota bacterium]|nr:hypothetical protein [Acidobacteriota bacterium]